jgi:hypothetical protein
MAVIRLTCIELAPDTPLVPDAQASELGATIFLEKAVAENESTIDLIEQHFINADLCTIEVVDRNQAVTPMHGIIRSFEKNGENQNTLLDLEIELI